MSEIILLYVVLFVYGMFGEYVILQRIVIINVMHTILFIMRILFEIEKQ